MPVTTIIYLVVMLVGVAAFMLWNKGRMKKYEAQSANARAGELAARMGLQLIEGDPMTNLMYARAIAQKSDGSVPEVKVRMVGSPGGRATEVNYYERVDVDAGFTSTTVTSWITASVSVEVRSPFPEFEVLLKDLGGYAAEVKPKLAAPPHAPSDPGAAKLVVKTHDARVVPVITESLKNMAAWGFVHVHGDGSRLTFHCTRLTATYLGIADQIHFALDEMAAALENAAAAHGVS